jgi:predicted nucleic acid-binding protein
MADDPLPAPFDGSAIIRILAKENPYALSTSLGKRHAYELLRDGMTVAQYLAAAENSNLSWTSLNGAKAAMKRLRIMAAANHGSRRTPVIAVTPV